MPYFDKNVLINVMLQIPGIVSRPSKAFEKDYIPNQTDVFVSLLKNTQDLHKNA